MNTELIRRALFLGLANTGAVKHSWPDLSDIYPDEAETINQALAELDRLEVNQTLLNPCITIAGGGAGHGSRNLNGGVTPGTNGKAENAGYYTRKGRV